MREGGSAGSRRRGVGTVTTRTGALLVCLLCVQCGGAKPTGPTGSLGAVHVFVGAGDIGECGSNAPQATSMLLDSMGGTVFTVGDNAYPLGTREEFRDCYEPAWGRHKNRTRPSPGNHDYGSAGAAPYFEYFGALAEPPGLGYYTFSLGGWQAFSLNSSARVSTGSTQAQWLYQNLASNQTRCAIAYWHHPLFSSGPQANQPRMRDVWRILYEFGVDVILAGHDHSYERFAPQDPDGLPDPARGIRQFVVGTGGAGLTGFVTMQANSEVRLSAHGVLKLTLRADGYEREFIPVSGAGYSGS